MWVVRLIGPKEQEARPLADALWGGCVGSRLMLSEGCWQIHVVNIRLCEVQVCRDKRLVLGRVHVFTGGLP